MSVNELVMQITFLFLKDGAMTGAPTITTYKAVRKNSNMSTPSPLSTTSSSGTVLRKQASVSPIMATPQNGVQLGNKVPKSLQNINIDFQNSLK